MCEITRAHDDLVHLSLRSAERARHRVREWHRCQPSLIRRAQDAIRWDTVLVGVVMIGLIVAVTRGLNRSRWRWSAIFASAFVLVYMACEVLENQWVSDALVNRSEWTSKIQWVSAMKFGALIGAFPMFLISFVIAVGDVRAPRAREVAPAGAQPGAGPKPPPQSSPRFSARFRRVVSNSTEWNTVAATVPTTQRTETFAPRSATGPPTPVSRDERVGVACSGGGIRSAAFNLGALQALDVAQAENEQHTEMERVRWMSAVSGGSYIASAWVSARAGTPAPDRAAPWSRGSAEEDHLRRHASYIAPGAAGKFWAFLRVLLGITMNVLLIVLVVAAVALPYGWGVGTAQENVPASGGGAITFKSDDATIRLPSGRILVAVRGQTVRLANGETARLRDKLRVVSLPKDGSTQAAAKIEVTNTAGEKSESSVVGTGQATVEQDVGDGQTATGEVTIGAADADESATTQPSGNAVLEPPAAVDGRKLESGTNVRIAPRMHSVEVSGRVLGCARSEQDLDDLLATRALNGTKPPNYRCHVKAENEGTRHRAHYVTLGDGADLVAGHKTILTLRGDAIVDGGFLVKACGAHQCERLKLPWLQNLVWGLLGLALAIGIITVAVRPRERMNAASQRTFRIAAVVALGFALLVLVLPKLVSWAEGERWSIEDRGRIAGVSALTVIIALISQVVPALGSGSDAKDPGKVITAVKKVGTRLKPLLVRLAVYLAVPLLLLALTLFFASLASQREFTPTQVALWLGLIGPLLIVSAGADLNQWSFHPYYRERLASAFGVDPISLQPREPAWLEDLPPTPNSAIELEVCAAANISDGRMTPPGRPVVPWMYTKTRVGVPALARVYGANKGTVNPREFTDKLRYLDSLWTAVAVSGAAFSPAMGKMTRPERALMALANLRLGVWYPNPTMLHDDPAWYQRHHPTPVYLAKEAFGLHRATDPWVYVTDGGHYENLGLLSLLRRKERCLAIYCFDASGDAIDTFGTIAEAMRLAREELGIEIDFDPTHLRANDKGISALGVWAGTVTYPVEAGHENEPHVGWIVFAKLEVPRNAPFDVVDLARTLPKFPNNPTTDQLYTDQKFEAYRALGHYLGEQAAKLGQDIRRRVNPNVSVAEAVAAANDAINPDAKATGTPYEFGSG